MILPKDCLIEILSHCDEIDLARMRCVSRTFKSIIDSSEYPLQSSLMDICKTIFDTQESTYHAWKMIRFLMRAKVGYQSGCLVKRFKRWLSHKKSVSFGKVVYKFSKTIRRGCEIYDFVHHKYDTHMEKRACELFKEIQNYLISL